VHFFFKSVFGLETCCSWLKIVQSVNGSVIITVQVLSISSVSEQWCAPFVLGLVSLWIRKMYELPYLQGSNRCPEMHTSIFLLAH